MKLKMAAQKLKLYLSHASASSDGAFGLLCCRAAMHASGLTLISTVLIMSCKQFPAHSR